MVILVSLRQSTFLHAPAWEPIFDAPRTETGGWRVNNGISTPMFESEFSEFENFQNEKKQNFIFNLLI